MLWKISNLFSPLELHIWKMILFSICAWKKPVCFTWHEQLFLCPNLKIFSDPIKLYNYTNSFCSGYKIQCHEMNLKKSSSLFVCNWKKPRMAMNQKILSAVKKKVKRNENSEFRKRKVTICFAIVKYFVYFSCTSDFLLVKKLRINSCNAQKWPSVCNLTIKLNLLFYYFLLNYFHWLFLPDNTKMIGFRTKCTCVFEKQITIISLHLCNFKWQFNGKSINNQLKLTVF